MKRCALCHGKLGLGVRYRNLWNGRWGSHSILFGSLRGAIQHQTPLVQLSLVQQSAELRNR
jgi:cytochrome c